MATYQEIVDCMARNPGIFDDLDPASRKVFMRWLPENVHVVNAFGKLAKYLKQNGNREYYSCYCIREKLRWDSMVSEVGTEYKISNNITPFVARLIMALAPGLVGMFRIKSSHKPDLFGFR